MAKITEGFIDELNGELEQMSTLVRVKYIEDSPSPYCRIVLENENMIETYMIEPTDELVSFIERYARGKDISIEWIRVSSAIWFVDANRYDC